MCKDCVQQRKKKYDTAVWYDYLIGFGINFVLSSLASMLAIILGGLIGFFMIFIAAGIGGGAGVFMSNVTLRLLNKRRSLALFQVCAAGTALGAIVILIFMLLLGNWFSAINVIIYAFVATPTVYSRVSGIQL